MTANGELLARSTRSSFRKDSYSLGTNPLISNRGLGIIHECWMIRTTLTLLL